MKVFCVGLPATGTGTFVACCNHLGLKASHLNGNYAMKLGYDSLRELEFVERDKLLLSDYEAFADFPIPIDFMWKGILEQIPDSKFILTTRDKDRWLKSYGKLATMTTNTEYEAYHYVWRDYMFKRQIVREPFLGLFLQAFEKHHKDVIATIPEDRLLVWDIPKNPTWDVVCKFLNKNIPDTPFPHRHERGLTSKQPRVYRHGNAYQRF